MNILIVDDEASTREGIIERIKWTDIGIDHIEEAGNGVEALKICNHFEPDIILTDLRMPRMDGLEMSAQIKQLFPECKIIFMSGFSDKEYLMSAINLRVIRYVEKPIIIKELEAAIKSAVQICIEEKLQKESATQANLLQITSIPLLKTEISVQLIQNNPNLQIIENHIKRAELGINPVTQFVCVLIRVFPACSTTLSQQTNEYTDHFSEILNELCKTYQYNFLFHVRSDGYVVILLYIDSINSHLFTPQKLKEFCNELLPLLNPVNKYFIATGKLVHDYREVYGSYSSAILNIQACFFRGYNSIILNCDSSDNPFSFDLKVIDEFSQALTSSDEQPSIFFVKRLTSEIKRHENTLANNVRSFYHLLSLEADKRIDSQGLALPQDTVKKFFPVEDYLQANVLYELEKMLIEKIQIYYTALKNENNSIIHKIHKYVGENHMVPDLSIISISEYTHMAPTYICAVYKNKTGKTINRYITEFRIEKGKLLLKDNDMKIAEIAVAIGCRDGNYFTKLFKKVTGITPTEYRERLL